MKSTQQKHGMVDVSEKDITKRTAIATSIIQFSKKTFTAFKKQGSPKGDVLESAKIAGIMAAKSVPTNIPMCHPLALSKVKITFKINQTKHTVQTTAAVVCLGRTGVEMEALCAASTAALTIYDMMKWADKGMKITDIKLLRKTGGKSGDYRLK